MGLSSLSQAFLASIDSNQNTRLAAEAHLEACSSNPDIPLACLTLAVSSDSHPVVQQSAAVFLKNLVLKYWAISLSSANFTSNKSSRHSSPPLNSSGPADVTTSASINTPDLSINSYALQTPLSINKPPPTPTGNNPIPTGPVVLLARSPFTNFSNIQINEFKQQVLYSLHLASPVVANYLSTIISIFLKTSGIPQWPDLMPITIKMLTDSDPNVIFSGVLVCLEIIRYMNNLPLQNQWAGQLRIDIVSLLFPQLLKIALSLSSETHSRAGLILWKILKCYKLAIRQDFPEYLQQEAQLKDWLSFFLHILSSTYTSTNNNSVSSSATVTSPSASSTPLTSSQQECPLGSNNNNNPNDHSSNSSSSSSSASFSSSSTSPSSQDSFSDFSSNKLLDCAARSSVCIWSKCKKNACIILSHLMVTYTSHTSSRVSQIRVKKNYARFSEIYLRYFGPDICHVFVKDIETWGQHFSSNSRTNNATDTPLNLSSSPSAVEAIINFFEIAISIDTLWQKILPKMEVIVSHLIFGNLMLSEPDLEAFYYNPEDYILTNIENSDFSTRGKALKFLKLLVKERQNDMFQGIIMFINRSISGYNEDPNNLQRILEKDAALQMMIELKNNITDGTSPISSQINSVILEQVISNSPVKNNGNTQTNKSSDRSVNQHQALLLSRSCEVITSFSNVVYTSSELEQVFRHVMRCFNDPGIIVQFNAAFALRMLFTNYDSICEVLGDEISQIMQKILHLYEEVNSECLASVMEDLIDKFTVQLAPFSSQLCSQLLDQFFRILGEINDHNRSNDDVNDDSEGFSFVDDRQMVAVGILNALGTLLIALEKSPTHIAKLEPYLLPMFKTIIENANYTFYQEVFELLDTCLYTLRCITPNMIQVIGMMRNGFKKNPSQCCEYYGPVLCNLFKFGFSQAKQQQVQQQFNESRNQITAYPPDLIDLSFEFVSYFLAQKDAVTGEDISPEDTETACTVAQTLFLTAATVGLQFDTTEQKYFSEIIARSLGALSRVISSVVTYRAFIEVILTAALYNPSQVSDILIQYNCFNWIIDVAASRSNLFNRPYDKAVAGLALLNIAGACSERGDGYEEVFPRVLNLVLTYMSGYYKHQQQEQHKARNRKSFVFAPNIVSLEDPFVYEAQNQHESTTNGNGAQQFTFVDESAQSYGMFFFLI